MYLIKYTIFELLNPYQNLQSYIYPFHPKYQYYNNCPNSAYRLAPDLLYLTACGLKKEPMNSLDLIIYSNCKPIYDVYKIIDNFY